MDHRVINQRIIRWLGGLRGRLTIFEPFLLRVCANLFVYLGYKRGFILVECTGYKLIDASRALINDKRVMTRISKSHLNDSFRNSVINNDLLVVEKLVERGADMNSRYSNGSTALISASIGDHTDMVSFLLAHDCDPNALSSRIPAMPEDLHYIRDIASLLRSHGVSIDPNAGCSASALRACAIYGRGDILKLLLERADIDVDAADEFHFSALHWAALYGRLNCVRLLVEHGGADANVRGASGLDAAGIARSGWKHGWKGCDEVMAYFAASAARVE